MQLDIPAGTDTVTAQSGDVLLLTREEPTGTGYSWVLSLAGPLTLVDDRREDAAAPQGMVGVPGRRTFRVAVEPGGDGPGHVMLHLVRPWEPLQPAERESIVVTVSSNADPDGEPER